MIDARNAETSRDWIVVWTESRAEKRVASRITAHGIDAWLPTVTERHRWSDRWREVVLPLFPGYLFARGAAHLPRLLRIPGVLTIVKAGSRPALLSEAFVQTLRGAVESPHLVAEPVEDPHDYDVNDEVLVQDGPLAGLRGVVRERRGNRHLVVWVREVGRGVAFTVSTGLLTRAEPRATATKA